MRPERTMVLFTKNCSPYRAGERAAFNHGDAVKLVARGVAEYAKPKTAEAEEPEAKKELTEEELAAIEAAEQTGEGDGDDDDKENGNGDNEQDDDNGSSEQDDAGNGDGEGEAEDEQPKAKRKRNKSAKKPKRKRNKLD